MWGHAPTGDRPLAHKRNRALKQTASDSEVASKVSLKLSIREVAAQCTRTREITHVQVYHIRGAAESRFGALGQSKPTR